MELTERVVLVTGASEGIGREVAKKVTDEGAHAVLAARSEDVLKELEDTLQGSLAVPTDVTSDSDVERLVELTVGQFGKVDILVNCAGRGMWATVADTNLAQYRAMMDVNVYGYLRVMQAVIPYMRTAGEGVIINVSSMVTQNHYPNLGGYTSTKCAVDALTLAARAELEKDGIKVCLIRPKLVETDFGRHAFVPEPDALRDRRNPNAPPMDTPDSVALKIVELVRTEAAELNLG